MKYYGVIAYGIQEERAPSVWEEVITEHPYRGDILKFTNKQESAGVNDDINVSNRLSIIGDPYAFNNFQHIKYVCWMGAKWKVTDVEVERPRLILTLSGVWNG